MFPSKLQPLEILTNLGFVSLALLRFKRSENNSSQFSLLFTSWIRLCDLFTTLSALVKLNHRNKMETCRARFFPKRYIINFPWKSFCACCKRLIRASQGMFQRLQFWSLNWGISLTKEVSYKGEVLFDCICCSPMLAYSARGCGFGKIVQVFEKQQPILFQPVCGQRPVSEAKAASVNVPQGESNRKRRTIGQSVRKIWFLSFVNIGDMSDYNPFVSVSPSTIWYLLLVSIYWRQSSSQ